MPAAVQGCFGELCPDLYCFVRVAHKKAGREAAPGMRTDISRQFPARSRSWSSTRLCLLTPARGPVAWMLAAWRGGSSRCGPAADLRRPGRGGVSALVMIAPGGRPVTSGEELVFCHQVTAAAAVVRRSGEVQAAGGCPIMSPWESWRRTCRTGRSRSWWRISAARRSGGGCCRPR